MLLVIQRLHLHLLDAHWMGVCVLRLSVLIGVLVLCGSCCFFNGVIGVAHGDEFAVGLDGAPCGRIRVATASANKDWFTGD